MNEDSLHTTLLQILLSVRNVSFATREASFGKAASSLTALWEGYALVAKAYEDAPAVPVREMVQHTFNVRMEVSGVNDLAITTRDATRRVMHGI